MKNYINSFYSRDNYKIIADKKQKGCFVIGTSIPLSEQSDKEIFEAYKKQSCVEQGYRFLKDPVFFASSLFFKKASRIEGY